MAINFLHAALWGFLGSFSLIIGGIIGSYFKVPRKIIASLITFSAGILSSAVCFEILLEAFSYGGIFSTSIGFLIGAILFTIFDIFINNLTIKNQEKSSNKSNIKNMVSNVYKNKFNKYYNKYQTESLTAVFGAIIEGIPEAIAIGLILFIGGPISYALLISIFLTNLFESLSGSTNMKLANWKRKNIIGVWILVTILATIASALSFIIFSSTDYFILSIALGISAGALISMIADVMLPEAFKETHELTGILMALGFLTSFILSHLMKY
ncbi:ZIP family metal transporter [Methanobrevibacter sp. DSM 116169]|uniref:ZIP family metal transporter n=1 Tax=Methanobrevibacter sp. DSM 116169 TaxID=3242727 RepID=UPI0038FD2862